MYFFCQIHVLSIWQDAFIGYFAVPCSTGRSLPHTHIHYTQRTLSLFIIGTLFSAGTALAQDTAFSEKPFTDVPEGSTYFEALEYLREKNILKGYIDGTFKPETRINRAEFVKFVVSPFLLDTNNMSACIKTNAPGTSENIFFPDTPRDSWYAAELCVAKTKQLINGYPDGMYRPEGNINFVEAAKILSNVFSLQVAGNETGEFWYRPYVRRLDDLNVIPASIKRFDQILTRGEMAEMVFRLKADRSDKATVNFSAIN